MSFVHLRPFASAFSLIPWERPSWSNPPSNYEPTDLDPSDWDADNIDSILAGGSSISRHRTKAPTMFCSHEFLKHKKKVEENPLSEPAPLPSHINQLYQQ